MFLEMDWKAIFSSYTVDVENTMCSCALTVVYGQQGNNLIHVYYSNWILDAFDADILYLLTGFDDYTWKYWYIKQIIDPQVRVYCDEIEIWRWIEEKNDEFDTVILKLPPALNVIFSFESHWKYWLVMF